MQGSVRAVTESADRPTDSDRRTFLKSLAFAAPLGQPLRWAAARFDCSYPRGYDTGRVDAARALTQHTRGVTDSPSTHTNLSYAATANGGASIHNGEAWTDNQRLVQLVDAQAVYVTGQRYAADGIVYTKKVISYADTVSYDRTRGDILVEQSTGADILKKFLPFLDFELQKTINEDGQCLFTYEATDLDTDSFTFNLRRAETVRSYTSSLTVDERGRIRNFAFDLDAWGDDGNPLTAKTVVELDDFGQATVQEPEWVQTKF